MSEQEPWFDLMEPRIYILAIAIFPVLNKSNKTSFFHFYYKIFILRKFLTVNNFDLICVYISTTEIYENN